MGKALYAVFFVFYLPELCFSTPNELIPIANYLECLNDNKCNAVHLGSLTGLDTLGDANLGIYDNTCGTNNNEPNPFNSRSFWNEAGVWFTFTTGPDPAPLIVIDGRSDPQNSGDDIDVEMAVYSPVGGRCDRIFQFVTGSRPYNGLDDRLLLMCPKPNTTYYILVDGANTSPGGIAGTFGLAVYQPDIKEGADVICDAPFVGAVPESGVLEIEGQWSNFCATGTGDPSTAAFSTQVGVWFEFEAPSSGHVLVEGIGEEAFFPLGIQLGVIGTVDGKCDHPELMEFASKYDNSDLDETLEVTCLEGGKRYWVLVDGFGDGGIGVFSLNISDAGDITPRTYLDTTICSGDQLEVGSSVYATSGQFIDTIQIFEGCDSIVFTNLKVLEPIAIEVLQISPGRGLGAQNGHARVNVSGGTGNYVISWSNGESGFDAFRLEGNQEWCVEVVDDLGCFARVCFLMDLKTFITANLVGDTLNCAGDNDGAIGFSFGNGVPPYTYSVLGMPGGIANESSLLTDGEKQEIEGLPAGIYQIKVNDNFSDTIFQVKIESPSPIEINWQIQQPISCFGACDGVVSANASGGVGGFNLVWENSAQESVEPSNLCAGQYSVRAIDGNGCKASLDIPVEEPQQIEVRATVMNHVSCFEGSDGRLEANTTFPGLNYAWSNGGTDRIIEGLSAGVFRITVSDQNGCEAYSEATIIEPEAPLEVVLSVDQAISCFNSFDGILDAKAYGPGNNIQYLWNDGSVNPQNNNLASGFYSVTVTNESGCTATDSLLLEQPAQLVANLEVQSISCNAPELGGTIRINNIAGGNPDYSYSINNSSFTSNPEFLNLNEGEYLITIRDQSNCKITLQSFIEGPPELSVDLGPDLFLQLGDSLTLKPAYKGNHLVFEWFDSDNLTEQGFFPNFPIKPIFSGKYSVVITDTLHQCSASDEIQVVVDKSKPFLMANAFSPNGDGANDEFGVFFRSDIDAIKTFRVFDRFGNLLFESSNMLAENDTRGWDGTFKGQELPSGIYVYYLVARFIDGRDQVLSGDVMLVR